MSYSEMFEWMEYLNLYPLHEDRSELQLAVLSSITINSVSSKQTGFEDFAVSKNLKTKENKEPKKLEGQELERFILGKMKG